jgi:hypothetical protein
MIEQNKEMVQKKRKETREYAGSLQKRYEKS